jgi:hypothetical protein
MLSALVTGKSTRFMASKSVTALLRFERVGAENIIQVVNLDLRCGEVPGED